MQGKIKKYFSDKSFGFIDYGPKGLFFHISAVDEKIRDKIDECMEVEFEIGENNKGPCAKNIKRYEKEIPDSFCLTKTKLPSDTRDTGFNDVDNFSLKLHKMVRWEKEGDKLKPSFYKTDKGRIIYQIKPNFGGQDFEEIAEKQKKSAEAICSQPQLFKAEVDSRLVIGLGSPSVYGTSMTLHHIYGIPYIPGQAVKGIARHWFLQEIMNDEKLKNVDNKQVLVVEKFFETVSKEKKSEDCFEKLAVLADKKFKDKFTIKRKNEKDVVPEDATIEFLKSSKGKCEEFQSLFGTQQSEGMMIFFDAFPTGEIKLKTDIMTSHYGDYYSGKEPPADYLSPNPIPFLTVEDTTFQFVVGVRKRFKEEKIDGKSLPEKAEELIKTALTQHGIGAKTAVGYGYFK